MAASERAPAPTALSTTTSGLRHAWQALYPPLRSHDQGQLPRDHGHALHWEQAGHPGAPAALVLHGGPGAGCSDLDKRWFNPARWRIVLLDQRGAGRSTPAGHLQAHGLAQALDDIEALREHLGLDRWLLFGGSWGSTLALAYAQRHPRRVTGLVLRGVFLASAQEHQRLYGATGAARLEPQAWTRLTQAAPATGHGLLDALAHQLAQGDLAAAHAWIGWEAALMRHEDGAPAPLDEATAPARARIGVHFARHHHFVEDGALLKAVTRLRHLPCVIVQGREDRVTPPQAAQALHQAWPGSVLHLIAGAGHSSQHPAMAQALVEATDRLCAHAG
ncbi:MAG: prolyl aminopeptidase [Rubrivivax sp.]